MALIGFPDSPSMVSSAPPERGVSTDSHSEVRR